MIERTSEPPSARRDTGWTQVLYWRINESPGLALKINALALVLAAVSGLAFVWIARRVGGAPKLTWHAQECVIFVVGIAVVLFIHEGIHGVLMRAFGARPRFGFYVRGGMFYAKAPGHSFTRGQYLSVVLGPLVGLSLLGCMAIALLAGTAAVWFVALWAIVNASASNADAWIAAFILRQPGAARVVDELDGFRVLVPLGDPGGSG